jgi:hypothetical protein
MPFSEGGSEGGHVSADGREYSRARSERHEAAKHSTGRKMRVAYFALASMWGFIVGAGSVLGSFQGIAPSAVPPSAGLLKYVLPAAVIAIGGGALIAGAYQEARRRRK